MNILILGDVFGPPGMKAVTEKLPSLIKKKKIDRLKEAESFDGKKSKYIDNEFDLVILSHVVEHVEYPREVISEAKRLGKMLYLEVPCEDNIRLSYNYKPDKTGHINFYSPKTFRRLLQTCDLHIENESLHREFYTHQDPLDILL